MNYNTINSDYVFKNAEDAKAFLDFLSTLEANIDGVYHFKTTKPLSITHPHFYSLKTQARKKLNLLVWQLPFNEIKKNPQYSNITLEVYKKYRKKHNLT
jgi:hypothetical protein